MLSENWNFKNDIALRLESKAQNFYDETDRPYTKIYDADAIESKNFVEVMIILLRAQTSMINDNHEIDEFVLSCAPYLGQRGGQILAEKAQELYDHFIEIFRRLISLLSNPIIR